MLETREYGTSGPPVVLLHGGPGAPGTMAPIGRELSYSFRLLEPFQRRSGDIPLTIAAHIADLLELVQARCPGDRPALVGSSWGATLALAFAAEHPDVAGPVVLIGSGTYTAESSDEFHRRLDRLISPGVQARLDEARNIPDADKALAAAGDVLTGPYSHEPLTTDIEIAWADARGHKETNDDWKRRRDEGTYPAAFTAIESPVLMLHGEADPHPGAMIRNSLLPALPQLEYIEYDRCGHYPWIEHHARDRFFRDLHGWLTDTLGRNRGP